MNGMLARMPYCAVQLVAGRLGQWFFDGAAHKRMSVWHVQNNYQGCDPATYTCKGILTVSKGISAQTNDLRT